MKFIYNNKAVKGRRRQLRDHQTEAEKILWFNLKDRKVDNYKFYRQYSVGMYILDFYCPKLRLCIEVDGKYHSKNEIKSKDVYRTNTLNSFNISVLRFSNDQIAYSTQNVVQKIREWIASANSPLE